MADIHEDSLRKTLTAGRLLKTICRAVVRGELSYKELRDFLENNVQRLGDDPDALQLDGTAWCLLSEMDLGHRTEWELIRDLARELGMPGPSITTSSSTTIYVEATIS